MIKLVAADHELVGVRGLTQASIEYTGGALELIASLIEMVQRREALLSFYGIQIPPILMALATAAAPALAVPPLAARRRERQAPARSRGRARGTRVESGPSEPILSDDDAEMSDSEEAVSQHSESSESGDDDTGSGFESGGDAEASSKAKSGDDTGSGSGLDSNNCADGDNAPESSLLRKRTKRASRA